MRSAPEALGLALLLVVVGCGDDGDDGGDGEMAADDGGEETDDAADGDDDDDAGSGDSGSGESGGGESGGEIGDGPWDSFEERPCPPDTFLTFENFGWPFMLTYCNGCHSSMLPADMRQGAPIEMNFDDLDDVRDHAGRIWARSGDQNLTMPPIGPADEEERALLGEWLACGAPTDEELGL